MVGKRQVFMLVMVFFMVFVVKIVKANKIHYTNLLILATYMVDKVMHKYAHFYYQVNALLVGRT